MYESNFTLNDLFSNRKLRSILPQVNYREKIGENGKVSKTTNLRSFERIVYDTSVMTARPFYDDFSPKKEGSVITLTGQTERLDDCAEAVYNAILAKKHFLVFSANNMEMIRSAIKEMPQEKLFIRANSIEEIKGMSKQRLYALMDEVMQNIFYNPAFQKTQKKFQVEKIKVYSRNGKNYDQQQMDWLRKVLK